MADGSLQDVIGGVTPDLEEAFLAHVYDPVQAHAYYEAHKHLKGRKPGMLAVASPPTHKHRTVAIAKNAKAGLGHEKRRAINKETAKAKAELQKLTDAFRSWVDAHPKATVKEKQEQRVKSLAQKTEVLRKFRETVAKISTPTKPSLLEVVRHDDLNPDSPAPTNTLAAIMAVPADLDPIRLVGDEDKHATIMFFGDTSTLPVNAKSTLLDVLAQVSKTTSPFRERIVNTSRLGADTPPALVAMLSNRFLGQIRNALQISPEVRSLLQNTPQFPEFTPHVTLGYPDYQGEAELRQLISELSVVRFDRLSLWWNGEHIDIDLTDRYPMDGDMAEAAWSDDMRVGAFLEHHGVKGMRWGVRKNDSGGGRVAEAALRAAGPRKASSSKPSLEQSKATAIKNAIYSSNAKMIGLNKTPKYRGHDLSKDPKLRAEYLADAKAMFMHQVKVALVRGAIVGSVAVGGPILAAGAAGLGIIGTAATSSNYVRNPSGDMVLVSSSHVQHDDQSRYRVTFMCDDKGFVTHITVEPAEIQHESTRIGRFLEHHGIKGMRWGVRRDRGSEGTVASAHGNSDAMHDGGGNLSADAERAVHTLQKSNAERSTREMKEAIDRFNQIQAYNKIFNPEAKGNSAIQRKIDGLKQQKELRQLQAELKPPSKVDKLIKRSTQAFSAFQAVDKVMGGTLSDGLVAKMGLKTISEAEHTASQVSLTKLKNDLLDQQARSIRSMAALNKTAADQGEHAVGDFPSMAVGYKGAGKRRFGALAGGTHAKRSHRAPN